MQILGLIGLIASLSASTPNIQNRIATLDFVLTQQRGAAPLQSPSVRVWVNLSSKVYHCPGTRYYGATKRGEFMSETDAEKTGSRPAYGRRCGPQESISILPSGRTSTSAFRSPVATSIETVSGADVRVWVNRKSRVYHCPRTQYYGDTKSGEFMKESEALASGNRPAYGRSCS